MPITHYEHLISITNCKNNKRQRPEGLNNEFYKHLPANWFHYVLNIVNEILTKETVPTTYIQLFLLYKKRSRDNPLNYRGIALLNCVCKLFTQIITLGMQTRCEDNNTIDEFQSGFRRDRGMTDNIFSLKPISHLCLSLENSSDYAIFIDFTLNHTNIQEKICFAGISAKLIMQSFYKYASLKIKIKANLANYINITKSQLQGEICFPLLFALFVNDIDEHFLNVGANIDGINDIFILACADDMIMFCDSPIDVNKKLAELHNYCKKNILYVNNDKTKILHFYKGR